MLTPVSNGVLALLSILPIASVAVFLVALRWPASRAMPITYVVCAVLALFVWQVPATVVTAATINGIVVAATLIFIIFGAIALLNTLQESGGLYAIRTGFTNISGDRRHLRPALRLSVFITRSLLLAHVHISQVVYDFTATIS